MTETSVLVVIALSALLSLAALAVSSYVLTVAPSSDEVSGLRTQLNSVVGGALQVGIVPETGAAYEYDVGEKAECNALIPECDSDVVAAMVPSYVSSAQALGGNTFTFDGCSPIEFRSGNSINHRRYCYMCHDVQNSRIFARANFDDMSTAGISGGDVITHGFQRRYITFEHNGVGFVGGELNMDFSSGHAMMRAISKLKYYTTEAVVCTFNT